MLKEFIAGSPVWKKKFAWFDGKHDVYNEKKEICHKYLWKDRYAQINSFLLRQRCVKSH